MESQEKTIAILHDRFPQIGGAEKVAIEFSRMLDAPIYTAYVDKDVNVPSDVSITPLFQDKYIKNPVTKRLLKWKSDGGNPIEALSVMFDLSDVSKLHKYDIVLESGPLSKSYVPQATQNILHYPHSPPRWLYDLQSERLSEFPDIPGKIFLKSILKVLRTIDKEANDYVDIFIGNSEIVTQRIERYYNAEAETIYPPIDSNNWFHSQSDDYYITWSRLTSEKRISLIAEAFTELDEQLVISGVGPEKSTISKIADENKNIDYVGYAEDIEKLVANSKAVIYAPVAEDFGMVGAEALLAGKPLIGVNEGFTAYQVTPETGVKFEPTVEDLQQTILNFDASNYDSNRIQEIGQQYSREVCKKQLKNLLDDLIETNK